MYPYTSTLTTLLFISLFLHNVTAANIRAIFLFKDVLKSNTTALQTSNFNTFIIFGVGVTSNGSIMYYSNTPGSSDILVASGGSYIGGPALAEKVRSFKTFANGTATGIDRLEISMNAQNIRALLSKDGTGVATPLARNFAALKEAWGLDAVNNDDESLYDVASTVSFAKVLAQLGYKYTIAPYTNQRFWVSVINEVNAGSKTEADKILDQAYLQCYDGGANNDPAAWAKGLGMKVVPLVWVTNDSKPVYGQTAAQARKKFEGWVKNGGLAGGGYWNEYDVEKMKLSYRDYGEVLRSVFP
ncbi:hypothetical protein B0J11DRAFT_478277 [Dendryphion nanum]|uniref:Coagulation factor 5/8 type domain-containing protein n=1 Tax=Dendryphion nanum TaxID=256645 RepID=A0A9P9IWM0_9PLEO|nr:hypothetical protein B0J11DRAFT_478277 [Dendryphion nanum]